eukprot:2741143-Pleurochrysis_carterae.AAC.1
MLGETQIHPTRLRFRGASNENMPAKGWCELDLHLGASFAEPEPSSLSSWQSRCYWARIHYESMG